MKPLLSRRERIEEVLALVIPLAVLALFAALGPRVVGPAGVAPAAAHASR